MLMKYLRKSVTVFLFVYVFFFATFLQGHTMNEKAIDSSAYDVPDEKKGMWESIRKHVTDEYNVCIEHCGNESNCVSRCQEVYKSRLDREYMRLMSR